MKSNNTIKYFKVILLVLAGCLLSYLLWMNFTPLGEQTLTYEFEESPFFEPFHPSTRATSITCDEFCYQEIFDDPVYIEYFNPRHFQHVNIELELYDEQASEVKLGLKVGDKFQYFEEVLEQTKLTDGWISVKADFNLKMAHTQDNKTTFIFTAPHIKDNEQTIKIRKIIFKLSKDTYTKRIINRLHAILQ